MNPNEIRKEILSDLISRDNTHNGYYEKLGIKKRIMDSMDSNSWSSNLWSLNKLKENVNITDKLITKYISEGNDLKSEIAFDKLKTDIDLIFKPKGIFSIFK
jgi:hypothetical protein